MGLAIKDVRFTTRRAGDQEPLIYPRLLSDRSILPKIAVAIDYYEGLIGRERQEVDAEIFVNFFGDHKLARCMVAALGTTYCFRSRHIAEVVSKVSARRLAKQGIVAPKLLRLAFFDDVNTAGGGFAALGQRDAASNNLAVRLKVRPAEVERVLYLDLDEHAILCRIGQRARPEQVAAQFNYAVLETLLRQAERIDLQVAEDTSVCASIVKRVCAAHGVAAECLDAQTVRLHGRRDALGNWSRHGRKLARAILEVLERGQSALREGVAILALPNRRVQLRLTAAMLAMLSGPERLQADWQDDLTAREETLVHVITEIHRRPGVWSLRRWPEPQASAAGVILPELRLQQADQAIMLSCVRSAAHADRLARLAAATLAVPYVFVGIDASLEPLRAIGARCLTTQNFDMARLETALGASAGLTAPPDPGQRAIVPIEPLP